MKIMRYVNNYDFEPACPAYRQAGGRQVVRVYQFRHMPFFMYKKCAPAPYPDRVSVVCLPVEFTPHLLY